MHGNITDVNMCKARNTTSCPFEYYCGKCVQFEIRMSFRWICHFMVNLCQLGDIVSYTLVCYYGKCVQMNNVMSYMHVCTTVVYVYQVGNNPEYDAMFMGMLLW